MSNMRRPTKLNQTGLSSLFFTLIMMVVISVIVLGFAQLSRRGQRESLDNQLSSQAYYAAESGVNDVVYAIQKPGGDTWSPSDATDCNDYATNNHLPTLTADNSVAYTCLEVDEAPQSSLLYNSVSQTQAQIVPINPTASLTGLTISWNQPVGVSGSVTDCDTLATVDNLPTQGSYHCSYPMLRIDILQRPAGSFTAAQLQQNTMTLFAKPLNSTAAGVGFNPAGPRLVGADCVTVAGTCSVTITGLGSSKYILHMSSLYSAPQTVTVAPAAGSVGKLTGAQAIVDATGRAQDVLRRVRVRVPLGDSTAPAGAAIVSNSSVCKRFTVDSRPNSYNDYSDGYNCPD